MPKREKMSIEHRAKQFLPFTALTELEIAIEEKNREYFERLESDGNKRKVREILMVLRNLDKNQRIRLTCLDSEESIVIGTFNGYDPNNQTLTIEDRTIPLNRIYEIRVED